MRPSFFHHLHPPTIPVRQSRFRYTLGAGGLSLFWVVVLFITGVLEMFFYIPTPEQASASIQMITYLVPFGALVRNMHYWSAQLLVITVAVHALRVLLTGGYAPPRRFNYLLGLALLVLALFLDFTGFVLRWDEGIRWALVAGTNLVRSIPRLGPDLYQMVMGGNQPGPATLIRFYTWHIFGLALVLAFVVGWHIFRVRRDGGIAIPPATERSRSQVESDRITRFELARREGLAVLLATAFLLLISAFLPAPIAPAMESSSTVTSDSRAPWFFLWVQQLLKIGDPFWMGVVLPLGVLLLLALVPYIFPLPRPIELGTWLPRGARLAQIVIVLIVIGLVILTLQAVFFPILPATGTQ